MNILESQLSLKVMYSLSETLGPELVHSHDPTLGGLGVVFWTPRSSPPLRKEVMLLLSLVPFLLPLPSSSLPSFPLPRVQ